MYTVVRCSTCGRCWGVKGKARKCPHCGNPTTNSLQIVSVVDNASELQKEVSIANMPESIRDELLSKIPNKVLTDKEPSFTQLMACIRIAAIDDVVDIERLAGALRGKGIRVAAEDVAEEGISQGLLMRNGKNEFLLLQ